MATGAPRALTTSLIARWSELDPRCRGAQSRDGSDPNDPLATAKGVSARTRCPVPPESLYPSGIPAKRMERLWSLAGATGGNRWQMGTPRKRLQQAETVATGCDQLPIGAHGKEEVDRPTPERHSARLLFVSNRLSELRADHADLPQLWLNYAVRADEAAPAAQRIGALSRIS